MAVMWEPSTLLFVLGWLHTLLVTTAQVKECKQSEPGCQNICDSHHILRAWNSPSMGCWSLRLVLGPALNLPQTHSSSVPSITLRYSIFQVSGSVISWFTPCLQWIQVRPLMCLWRAFLTSSNPILARETSHQLRAGGSLKLFGKDSVWQ